MDYENCEYFVTEDVTPYHNDVFDHPQYDYFCTKNGKKTPLYYPAGQCGRCLKKNNKGE